MDFGAYYQGSCSDMTRTVMIGRTSDNNGRLRDRPRSTEAGDSTNEKRIGGREVGREGKKIYSGPRYGEAFGHSTGHGLGMEAHERVPPYHTRMNGSWKPGMIVTVEPGIYLPDVGGHIGSKIMY